MPAELQNCTVPWVSFRPGQLPVCSVTTSETHEAGTAAEDPGCCALCCCATAGVPAACAAAPCATAGVAASGMLGAALASAAVPAARSALARPCDVPVALSGAWLGLAVLRDMRRCGCPAPVSLPWDWRCATVALAARAFWGDKMPRWRRRRPLWLGDASTDASAAPLEAP